MKSIKSFSDVDEIRYATITARRIVPSLSERDIAISLNRRLAKSDPRENLGSVLSNWLEGKFRKSEFPSPPWKGSNQLKPLSSPTLIFQTAKKYENCLTDYIPYIVAGSRYFYIWQGPETAVVALENDGLIGWAVSEILGPGNKPVQKTTKNQIESILSDADFITFNNFQNLGIRWNIFP